MEAQRTLDADELVAIAQKIYESGVWRQHVRVDAEQRVYHLLAENDHLSVWILSWMPGQSTGFHDHAHSQVGLVVAQGALEEQQLTLNGGVRRHTLGAGDQRRGGVGYIHNVLHHAGVPAVSIHAYSPRLTDAGIYRERDGTLIRLPEAGDRELSGSRLTA